MADGPHGEALETLEVLVGEWRIETSLDLDPSLGAARTTFEWALDGKFLIQRAKVPGPIPDSLAVISTDPGTGAYTQHYFDSRGVVRVFEMELSADTWTLLRTKPDFTPLTPWPQRYVGNFEDENGRISGRWEKARRGTGSSTSSSAS